MAKKTNKSRPKKTHDTTVDSECTKGYQSGCLGFTLRLHNLLLPLLPGALHHEGCPLSLLLRHLHHSATQHGISQQVRVMNENLRHQMILQR